MEVVAGVPAAAVSAVKSDHVVALIFHPDASQKSALARLRQRGYVEHQAPYLAQKFALHVIELVVLLVESIRVDEDHLQKAVR